MKFKEIHKAGVSAWSPHRAKPFVAVANASQQFDNNFGSESKIEIFDLNVHDADGPAVVHSSCAVGNTTFTSLCWHPDEKLVFGTKTASIQIYDVSSEIKSTFETSPSSEKGFSVNCLDLNANDLTSICSGSDDGSVTTWKMDASVVKNLTLSPTLSTTNDAIVSVRWNKQIPSVLASVSASNVYVYDTRKQGQTAPIMQVCDNNSSTVWGPGPASVIYPTDVCWSNTQSTSLILAVANDGNPHLQLWDLRYTSCPVKYLQGGHTRGLSAVAWNSFDESILLSASKDNSVCVWNPLTPENQSPLVSILPDVSSRWIHDIKWCPWEPSIFTVSSSEEHTSLYNLTKSNFTIVGDTNWQQSYSDPRYPAPQQYVQPILTVPPKWFRQPCGASWAFGGKLITYSHASGMDIQEKHAIVIQQVAFSSAFLSRVEKFNSSVANDNLLEYCKFKTNEFYAGKNEPMGLAWRMLSTHFYPENTERIHEILLLLGYPNEDLNFGGQAVGNSSASSMQSPVTNTTSSLSNSYEDYEDRQTCSGRTTATTSPEQITFLGLSPTIVQKKCPLQIETNEESLGSLINKCILTGNYEKALDSCVKSRSWGEAFLIAWFLAPESISSILKQYFSHLSSSDNDKWSLLLWCIVSGRFSLESEKFDVNVLHHLVSQMDLKYWREVLVFLLKQERGMERQALNSLIDGLANRLIQQQREDNNAMWIVPAMYCYILNKNYEKIAMHCEALCGGFLNLAELVLVLKNSNETIFETPHANSLCVRFAESLVNEGKLEDALYYLQNTADSELKTRLLVHCNAKRNINSSVRNTFSSAKPISNVNRPGFLPTRNPLGNIPERHVTQPGPPGDTAQFSKRYPRQVADTRPPSVPPNLYHTQHADGRQPLAPPNTYPIQRADARQPVAPPNAYPIQRADARQPLAPPNTYPTSHADARPPQVPPNGYPTSPTDGRPPSVPPNAYPTGLPDRRPSFGPPPVYQNQLVSSRPGFAPQYLYQTPQASTIAQPASAYPAAPTRFDGESSGWNDPPVIKQSAKKTAKPLPAVSTPVPLLDPSEAEPTLPLVEMNVQGRRRRFSSDRTSQSSAAILELSVENQQMYSQFEALLQQLHQQLQIKSQIPLNLKRKLDDIRSKLDSLRIKLASNGQLSSSTVNSLKDMVNALNQGDFNTALAIHNHLVASTTFAETSDFLPGIKVLLHLAQQHLYA